MVMAPCALLAMLVISVQETFLSPECVLLAPLHVPLRLNAHLAQAIPRVRIFQNIATAWQDTYLTQVHRTRGSSYIPTARARMKMSALQTHTTVTQLLCVQTQLVRLHARALRSSLETAPFVLQYVAMASGVVLRSAMTETQRMETDAKIALCRQDGIVQLLARVWMCAAIWTSARQAHTTAMSKESVMIQWVRFRVHVTPIGSATAWYVQVVHLMLKAQATQATSKTARVLVATR